MDMKKIYLFAMLFCAIQLFAGHSAVLRVKTNSGKTFEIEKIMDSSNEGASIKISKDGSPPRMSQFLKLFPISQKQRPAKTDIMYFPTGCGESSAFAKMANTL